MNRNYWSVIALVAVMIAGAWLWTSLHQKATNAQTERIHAALDQVEQDMGTYDPDSARSTSATKRAKKVSGQMQEKAEEHRRLLDSLTRAEREDLGDHTLDDPESSR